MNQKTIISSILIAGVLIGVAIMLSSSNKNLSNETAQTVNNVSMVDDQQIITIAAKGGYSPRVTNAKADMPTIIKVATNGTFDCSSAITIPSIGYRTNLPPSGSTDIVLPPQSAGTTMQGLCTMGMYNFSVNFN